MKKIIAVFLCVLTVATFAFGCGGGGEANSSINSNNTSSSDNKLPPVVTEGENVFSEIDFSGTPETRVTVNFELQEDTLFIPIEGKEQSTHRSQTSATDVGVEVVEGIKQYYFLQSGTNNKKEYVFTNEELNVEELLLIANNLIWYFGGEDLQNSTEQYHLTIDIMEYFVFVVQFIADIEYDQTTTVKEIVEKNGIGEWVHLLFDGVSAKTVVNAIKYIYKDFVQPIFEDCPPKENQSAINYFDDLVKYFENQFVYEYFQSMNLDHLLKEAKQMKEEMPMSITFVLNKNKKISKITFALQVTTNRTKNERTFRYTEISVPDNTSDLHLKIQEKIKSEMADVNYDLLQNYGTGKVGYSYDLKSSKDGVSVYSIHYGYLLKIGEEKIVDKTTIWINF